MRKDWEERFVKIHFEPEHSDGGVCWCNPKKTAVNGILHIEHNEQRTVLVEFIKELMND